MGGGMHAIDRALEAARQPKQLAHKFKGPLPDDMLEVIKCAAGDEGTLTVLASGRNVSQQKISDAARVYLQHIITHANGSDRMVLALPQNWSSQDVREHKRWMLKWLHPDRNPSAWEANLFHRVKEASDRIENGTAKDSADPAAAVAFQRRKPAQQRRFQTISSRPSAGGLRHYKLRKRDIVKLLIMPFVLAVCVTALASFAWLRFGPQGGL